MIGAPELSPEQCHQARMMLNWTERQLAAEAGVSADTIAHFEGEKREVAGRPLYRIVATFWYRGIDLSRDENGVVTVRLRARSIDIVGPPSWQAQREGVKFKAAHGDGQTDVIVATAVLDDLDQYRHKHSRRAGQYLASLGHHRAIILWAVQMAIDRGRVQPDGLLLLREEDFPTGAL
jgi:hypothetical protein